MKKYVKLLIVLLTVLLIPMGFHVQASTGYTYDHTGQPIYSTIGLTVNQAPYIASSLGIANIDFTSPEDLFVYRDENDQITMYIADSASNKIFILNESFQLQETLSKFRVDVTRFSDDVLRAIKSQKSYVIARDKLFTIPQTMEYTYLVHNVDVQETLAITYEITNAVDFEYTIEWESNHEDIATVEWVGEAGEEIETIVTHGVGIATVTGTLYKEADPNNPESERESMATVSIRVTVTDEPLAEIPVIEKNHDFSLVELKALGTFNLYLNSVTCVYRAVNPNTGEDYIYLADKGNNQVVVIDSVTHEVVQFVTTPDDVAFADKSFVPTKVITDGAGRMYIIADNVYEGIMQFSREGIFNRFTGVNYVSLTPWEIFWRNFSTEAQLAKQSSIINTSFTSMSVDKNSFIYTTSFAITNSDGLITDDNSMIKKINPSGKDVLRRNGYQPPKGDVVYVRGGTLAAVRNPSKFVGITVNDYGVYTVVDSKMGRLFTYDNDGKLLYISGDSLYLGAQKGTQITSLSNPVAIRYHGENILVLDKNNKAILVFEPTDIGAKINQAVNLEYIGDMVQAADIWEDVVRQNANYEYGYIGIGKKYLKQGEYQLAMEYFEIGADRALYSKAFKLYRDRIIRQYFSPVMITLFALIAARVTYRVINRKKFRKDEETGIGDE